MFRMLTAARAQVPRGLQATQQRAFSEAARPMTRFVQYPFDKSKMTEVRAWVNESGIPVRHPARMCS